MPNHIHGIIVIEKEKDMQAEKNNNRNLKGHRKGSLGLIVSQYKAAVKRFAVKNNIEFNWQDGYYEHIIRNEKSMIKISEYIQLNPLRWELDEYNK
jgi:REP element-mobilizing transposase RayT